MSSNITKPPCPMCGRKKSVHAAGDYFKCTKCGALFDDDNEEGGDYDTRNPAARLEREERQRGQRQQPRRNY